MLCSRDRQHSRRRIIPSLFDNFSWNGETRLLGTVLSRLPRRRVSSTRLRHDLHLQGRQVRAQLHTNPIFSDSDSGCCAANVNEQLQETIRLADETIVTFISTLASLDVEAPQDRKCHFVMLHCIAYSSLIVLHEPVSSSDPSAYGRCLHAARLISATLGYLKADEVASLPVFVIVSVLYLVLQN